MGIRPRYYWRGLDLTTGEIFGSRRRGKHRSLDDAKECINLYIAEHLSDRDPEDFVFEVFRSDSRRGDTIVYTDVKEDIGEGCGISGLKKLLSMPYHGWYKLRDVKKSGTLDDMDTGDLDLLQKCRLVHLLYKIKQQDQV